MTLIKKGTRGLQTMGSGFIIREVGDEVAGTGGNAAAWACSVEMTGVYQGVSK